jgi:hypothetical protein
VSCTIGHCAAMMWPCLRGAVNDKNIPLVLHLWFYYGETLLGLLVCDFVFGYIRD